MDNRIFKYVVHLSFSPPAFLEQLILINGFAFLARFSSWRKWSSRVAKSIASCSFRSPLLSDRAGMSRLCSQKTDDDDDDDFPFRGKEGRKEGRKEESFACPTQWRTRSLACIVRIVPLAVRLLIL